MKKLLSLLIPCMILFVGCGSSNNASENQAPDIVEIEENIENPPSLTVTLPHGSFECTIQKYDWTYKNSDGTDKNEVKVVVEETEVVNGASKLAVASGEKMTLKFSSNPKSYDVKMVLPNTMDLEVNNNEVVIPTPSNKGKATIRVDATFNQGTVTYMFNLDIEG